MQSAEEDHVRRIVREEIALAERLTQLQGDVAGLRGDVTRLQEDVTGLRGDVTQLQEDVTRLREAVVQLQTDQLELRSEVKTMELAIMNQFEVMGAAMEAGLTEMRAGFREILDGGA